MTEHTISVDEAGTLDGTAYKSFCWCGWSENRWHHADEFPEPSWDSDAVPFPVDAAHDAAARSGAAHVVAAESAEAWRAHAAARYR
jgi:hypothetical protein